MAWIGPAIGAGASIIGGMMGSSGQQAANQMQMQIAQKEMDWETQMSNTAMQRRVTDLKAAGLNPMLAVGQGGANVPQPVMPNIQNPSASMAAGLQSAGQIASQVSQQSAQVDATRAQADKTRMDTAQSAATLPYTGATSKAQLDQLEYRTRELVASAGALNAQADKAGADARLSNMSGDFQQRFLQLRNDMSALDVQRMALGMPRLEDDAAWQKAHPTLSGWLQSGAPAGLSSVTNSAIRAATFGQ